MLCYPTRSRSPTRRRAVARTGNRCAALIVSALALVPALGVAAAVISIPAALSLALVWTFGRETLGRDLRELETAAGARTDVLR